MRFAHRSVSEYLSQRTWFDRSTQLTALRPSKGNLTTLREIEGQKAQRENELSFRDDRPWACHLASWRLGGSNIRIPEFSTPRKFARAAQIFNCSSTEFTKKNRNSNFEILLRASAVSHMEA